MSLARALTKRYRALEASNVMPSLPGRMASTRKYDRPIDRAQISLPVELLSTTNVLAYEAPDIHGPLSSSSLSSGNSFDESDSCPALSSSSSISTPESLTRESSPVTLEPNHLSTYFDLATQDKPSRVLQRQSNASSDADVPAIPTRAMSHTKKSHQISAVKRSSSKVRDAPLFAAQSSTSRSSLDMFSGKPDVNHPFGAELAQVNELVEEFGAKNVMVWDEDEKFLMEHGLQRFGAEDYVSEIQGLFRDIFEDQAFSTSAGWI